MKHKYLFKVLNRNNDSCDGGSYHWSQGKWTSKVENPLCCSRGYHLAPATGVKDWNGGEIWLAEGKGKFDFSESFNDKYSFSQARIMKKLVSANDDENILMSLDQFTRFLRKEARKFYAKKVLKKKTVKKTTKKK